MRIAFYLNLQGAGHSRRFEAIARHLPADCELAVIGMGAQPQIANMGRPVRRVSVPRFGEPSALPFVQQQTSHDYHDFAVNHGQNAPFCLGMVSFLSRWQPDLMVVDVGLEASILARMCGIPTIYMRQHGCRWDRGHQLAYEWACSLLAPFDERMEQAECPDWIQEKTVYSGGFSRFSGWEKSEHMPISYANDRPNILVMTGFGGTEITRHQLMAAASATPAWQWHFVGAQAQPHFNEEYQDEPLSRNVCYHGVVEDIWPYLCHAALVVSNAGHNSTMEIMTAGVPALFIPAKRPFTEQACKAEMIESLNLGVVSTQWPEPSDWRKIYARSHALDPMLRAQVQSAQAPKIAADHIANIARQCMTPAPVSSAPQTFPLESSHTESSHTESSHIAA